jgi:hypothetical protein
MDWTVWMWETGEGQYGGQAGDGDGLDGQQGLQDPDVTENEKA